jgi:hypothetical protein
MSRKGVEKLLQKGVSPLTSVEDVQTLFKSLDTLLASCLLQKSESRGNLGSKKQWLPLQKLKERGPCIPQTTDNDCGVAAMKSILRFLDQECDFGNYDVADGFSGNEIVSEAKRCGVHLKLLWDTSEKNDLEDGGVVAYLMHGSDRDTGEGFAVPLCGSGFSGDRSWPSARQVVSAMRDHNAFLLLYRHTMVYDEGHYLFVYKNKDKDQWYLCDPHHPHPFVLPSPSYAALMFRGAETLIAT